MKTDILIIGGGPAGLSAALTAKELGAKVMLVDENPNPGGQLIKQTHKFFGSKQHWCGVRGIDIASLLLNLAKEKEINVLPDASAIGIYNKNVGTPETSSGSNRADESLCSHLTVGIVQGEKLIGIETKGIIMATGAQENMLTFKNNDLPGVYGAGAVQTLVNVFGVPPGKKVLMIGSGNIGLIVSYQLMQAGIKVVGIVEAMPKIGGYLVHASKVRKLGVPIYTSHTIKEALGTQPVAEGFSLRSPQPVADPSSHTIKGTLGTQPVAEGFSLRSPQPVADPSEVKGAIIVKLDKKWPASPSQGGNEIPGTEQKIDCDVICLAVGLTPSIELLSQVGCETRYIPELGGWVAWHNEKMQTSIENIFVAGDASGIEEAVTAILEGKVAGAACAQKVASRFKLGWNLDIKKAQKIISKNLQELKKFRKGPFGEKTSIGKKKLTPNL